MPRSPGLVTTLLAVLKAGAAFVPLDPSCRRRAWSSCSGTAGPRSWRGRAGGRGAGSFPAPCCGSDVVAASRRSTGREPGSWPTSTPRPGLRHVYLGLHRGSPRGWRSPTGTWSACSPGPTTGGGRRRDLPPPRAGVLRRLDPGDVDAPDPRGPTGRGPRRDAVPGRAGRLPRPPPGHHRVADGRASSPRWPSTSRRAWAGCGRSWPGATSSAPPVAALLRDDPGLILVNGYGPTENTTFTACHVMAGASGPEAGEETVPIGRPDHQHPGLRPGRHGRPAPPGVAGGAPRRGSRGGPRVPRPAGGHRRALRPRRRERGGRRPALPDRGPGPLAARRPALFRGGSTAR